MTDEWKACPFCGSSHAILDEPVTEDQYGVFCQSKCGAIGPCDEDGEYAISLWNTRPIEDALRAEVEALKAAQRWIPVTERQPDTSGVYLAYKTESEGPIRFGILYYEWPVGWLRWNVSHWCHLPTPPEAT